jgi:hypothetical protein
MIMIHNFMEFVLTQRIYSPSDSWTSAIKLLHSSYREERQLIAIVIYSKNSINKFIL